MVESLSLCSDADRAAVWLAAALRLQDASSVFPWQLRLLTRLREGHIPRSLDVPTGLGKTATMAVWLVSRALRAPVPRRLIYVVDRRVVVDQATRVAEQLREWVDSEPGVRDALGLKRPLPVSTLRGQFIDNREWLEDPASPAIVVGTVDMIGSRLLFEGYRATRKIRSYLAGLLGNDCLFVLDEAHLVPPFERLLERVALDGSDLGPAEDAALRPPQLRLLSLSATGRSRGGEPFDLDEDDVSHPVVQQRLSADKRLIVTPLGPTGDLVKSAAEHAWRLTDGGTRPVRCIVFLDRREDAEEARRCLDRCGRSDGGSAGTHGSELLVGARRVFERTLAARRLEELGFLAGTVVPREGPTFLFATSAGEVGIDLDADHMVCDLVAWERMVQRLGRVNRRGHGQAEIVALHPRNDPQRDPGTLERLDAVLGLLERLPLHASGGEARDGSPRALRELHRAARSDGGLAAAIAAASTPEPLHPPLERATLEAWSMTSLVEHPGRPAVAPWLRGWIESKPQTTVAWRTYLPLVVKPHTDGECLLPPSISMARRFFEAAPLHTVELLETESFRVAEWAMKRARRLRAAVGKDDVSAHALREDTVVLAVHEDGEGGEDTYHWLTLRNLDELSKPALERMLSASEVIADVRFGGLSAGMLDASCDELPPTADGDGWQEVSYRIRETDAEAPVVDATWRERERLPQSKTEEGEVERWLVVEKRLADAATEEDRSAGRLQTLSEHQDWTANHAEGIAGKLGLAADATQMLVLAARLHDEGKRAACWQAAFNAPEVGRPYAKTRGPVNRSLLGGYRHELGSLIHAEEDVRLLALPTEHRDLVLHLIASHHGFARPVIATDGCDDAPPSALAERARQVALRFIRLQTWLGPWGLAWWEALLRAADQAASRQNDRMDLDGLEAGF